MKLKAFAVCAALALCAAQACATPKLPFTRGTNCRGLDERAYSSSTWYQTYIYGLDSTYTDIKEKGFDYVRFSVDLTQYYDSGTDALKTSGNYDIGIIDGFIQKFLNAGLYVHLLMGRVDGGAINLSDTDQKERFKRVWQLVAEHYQGWSDKLAFELCNEPGTPYGSLNTLEKQTVALIRQTNPTRLILWPVGDGSQPWVLTQAANPPKFDWVSLPAGDTNIAIVVHTYAPADFTHQGADWSYDANGNKRNYHVDLTDAYRAKLREDLTYLSQYAKANPDVPIVLNEFGVMCGMSYESDAHEWLGTVREFCEANNIAWAHFEYTDFNNYKGMASRSNPTGDTWRTNVVDALFPKGWDDVPGSYGKPDLSAFSKKMTVSFTGYAGTAPLADFPVLVKLSTAISGFSYSDFQKANGGDLRFVDSHGNLIPHEIDTWNPSGVSTVWVKVPELSASTRIYACYGCANPPAVTAMDVWDDDYVGVWHLGEGTLPLRESTRRGPCFTQPCGVGPAFASSGVVGSSVNFDGGMSNAVIAVDHRNLDGFERFTVEAWTKQGSHKSSAGILGKRQSYNKYVSYFLYDTGSKTKFCVSDNGTNCVVSFDLAMPASNGGWEHQAFSLDTTTASSNVKGYLNGAPSVTASQAIGRVNDDVGFLTLGNLNPNGKDSYFNGSIDEVRISKCVRSAAWLKATHDTVAKADFATYVVDGVASPDGPEEPVLPPVEYGPLATNQYAKSMNVLFAGAPNTATLTNFPVLVKLSAAIDGFSYADFSRQNGGDLRFADASGNLLPHEIDTWNPSGVSTVWVKVPLLKKNSYITAHYGFTGSGDPAAVDPKDVWDDDYVGVWHLGESALPLKESSETSSDFESSYGDTINYATNGIVGRAVGFPEGGLYNSIVAPDHDALDGFSKFTVEYWTFQLEHKSNAGVLSKRKEYNNDAAYYLYDAYDANSDKWSMPFCIGTNKNTSARWSFNLAQTLGEWNHIVYSADMSSTTKNVHGFRNGAMNGWEPDAVFFGQMPNSAEPLVLGNLGANKKDNSFNGSIDEVRISKTVRSKEWVKATYETIANDGFAVCSFGEIDFGENITNLLLKASTDKANPIGYVENEDIRFDFRLDGVTALPLELRAKAPLHVIWTRRADDGVTVTGTNTISVEQGFSVTTRLAIPGIVKMTGTLVGSDYKAIEYYNASNEKKSITFGGGAGVATEKMTFYAEEPADFDQFWAEAKAKLAAVPMTGTELVEVFPKGGQTNSFHFYAAKVPCLGPTPVTGWLVVPKNAKAKSLSIRATFAGYGCITTAPTPPTWGDAREIRFEVNAHGYDLIGHDNQYYQDFYNSINKTGRPLNSYNQPYTYALAPQDYDNPTNTYFYYMTLRAVRAFDYLKSRPEWDGTNVVATGGSQGGAQTMWAAGLVDGMTKIQPSITGFCDVGCPWDGHGPYPSRSWGIPCVPGAYYFDAALHAKRVPRNCVAEITRLGMGDYTCPPRGVLLSYYNMKCAVSAKLVQGSDHGYIPPQPNQQFTISKAAVEELLPPSVADAEGFDWTNRVVTVTGAQAGKTVTLSLSGRDGTPVEYTATADSSGSATFDVQTAPGASYSYTVTQEGAAPASGSFSSGAWKDAGTWFSGAVENNALVASGGNWVGEPAVVDGGNALSGNASFALDADAVETGSNRLVRVDFDIVSGQFCLESDLGQEEGAMFGCIAAVASSAGNAWFAYDGSAWHRLYGDYTLAEDAAYIVRAELDLAQGEKGAVRYFVSDNGGTSFAPLFADASSASAWIPCNAADSRAVKSVTTEGTKTLASVGGSLMGADIAEADGVGYESLADAIAASTNSLALLTNATWPSDTPVGTITVGLGGHSLAGVTLDGSGKVVVGDGYSAIPGEGKINISLAQAAALGVSTDGKSPAQIASALAENGANGIPLWQSYALGLDPADATAKPKATIAMNGDTVELRLVGITVNTASGATVTYKAYKSADLADMANAEPASGDKAVDATASVPKGASEDRMFYQLKVDVKGY